MFRSTFVKSWVRSKLGNKTKMTLKDEEDDEAIMVDNLRVDEDMDLVDKPRKIQVKKGSPEEREFSQYRKGDQEGLMKYGSRIQWSYI